MQASLYEMGLGGVLTAFLLCVSTGTRAATTVEVNPYGEPVSSTTDLHLQPPTLAIVFSLKFDEPGRIGGPRKWKQWNHKILSPDEEEQKRGGWPTGIVS